MNLPLILIIIGSIAVGSLSILYPLKAIEDKKPIYYFMGVIFILAFIFCIYAIKELM